MSPDLNVIHPELRASWRSFPRLNFNAWNARLFQWISGLQPKPPVPAGIQIENVTIQSKDTGTRIRLRTYRPRQGATPAPALVWIHGGGYILGSPEQDDGYACELAADPGLVVVSVDYRLAPRNPFPAAVEDCYSALEWVHASADRLGIDPQRIAIGGASAGGGLAACLAQLAQERGKIQPAMQLLVYPMLDDRTVLRTDLPHKDLFTWNQPSNRYGWEAYLGQPAGLESAPKNAVAARRENLAELPPAWIGVGTLDLFHDEDTAYALRLRQSGVACELLTVPGAFHGFDVFKPELQVVRDFRTGQKTALKKYLFV